METAWKVVGKQGGTTLFQLPIPDPYRLEHPPLALATAQVKFPLVAQLQSHAGIAPFQTEISPILPYLEQIPRAQQMPLLGAPGATVTAFTTGFFGETTFAWKFTNDEGWILSLEPAAGTATLSVGRGYQGWADFAQKWRTILAALAGPTGGVKRCDRVSVRYLDLIVPEPPPSRRWLTLIRPELSGWIGVNIFRPGAQLWSQLTESQVRAKAFGAFEGLPVTIQGTIQHGLVPMGTKIGFEPLTEPLSLATETFVLDIDLHVEGRQTFDSGVLTDQFATLHEQIDAFFRWALTSAGEAQFGVVPV